MTHAPGGCDALHAGGRTPKACAGGARARRPQPRPPPPQDGHTPTRADPNPSQRPAEVPACSGVGCASAEDQVGELSIRRPARAGARVDAGVGACIGLG